uniref:histidine kinase n=1 Tax=Desulfatirhabdium butyrativorans TaxID=340467 RepID=A0A7C4W223_9BACT
MQNFLDEYFVECDEHLTTIQRDLTTLESYVDRAGIEKGLLERLFRAFHTLKGLSGMVGFQEAEQIAHQIEAYLRKHREAPIVLTSDALDAIIAGANLLTAVIASKQQQGPMPDIEEVLHRLDHLVRTPPLPSMKNQPAPETPQGTPPSGHPAPVPPTPAPPPAPMVPREGERETEEARLHAVEEAIRQGKRIWQVMFTPSQERAFRGVHVNSVRERLSAVGEIVHAEPLIDPHFGIAFLFLVAVSGNEVPDWKSFVDDGIQCQRYQEPVRVDSAAICGDVQKTDATPICESSAPSQAPSSSVSEPSSEPGATDAGSSLPLQSTRLAPSNIVRVDLDRLNDLMRLVGELVISRARLEDNISRLEAHVPQNLLRSLQETHVGMERQLRALRESVMRIRMVPIGEVFERMRFVVRDLVRESGKKVHLETIGQATEIDKFVVERIMDPLLHLVRNAVSHGLESPEARRAAGKPEEGRMVLKASAAGDVVVIEIEDDGAGIDRNHIVRKAREKGIPFDETATDEALILSVICSPGFSTRDAADRVSGRGVGMTVVRDAIQELGGELGIRTTPGQGTTFIIRLPLTLAIADAFIVQVADQVFAVPQALVHEIVEIHPETIVPIEGNEIVPYRNAVIPLIRLGECFHLPMKPNGRFFALVMGSGLSAVGIGVDRVVGRKEIVVRAITDPLLHVPGISGATELGDGRVVLILDGSIARKRLASGGRS